jgi:tetratricopeptide (TPR) repeat protein
VKSAVIALIAGLAFMPATAKAEESAPVQQQISLTAAAALLIQADRLDDAERVLALALQQNPNDNEAIFLHGLIAVARKNYDGAVEDFRRILAAEPDRERVRLELARAFFLETDYDNAERNFRFARAGDLPDETKAIIDQYLAAILRLRRWSYNLSLGVADDTNVNGATNQHTIYLYGLPFTLSDNARQTSGVGAAVDISGQFSPVLSADTKFLAGGFVHRLQYGRSRFDDLTVSTYAGPEILLGRWRFDILATGFGRWYGEVPYSDGMGGRASVGYALLPTLQLGLTLDGESVSFRPIRDQDGPIYAANGEIAYTLSPSRILRVSGGVAAQEAKLSAYANTTLWVALDYYQDLPFGFSTNFEPAYSATSYNAPLAAFGRTRADHALALRLDVLNRRLEYRGFAPRLSLIYVTEQSSISLYRFSRTQVQVGVTRQF